MKMTKCRRKITAHILKLVALSRSALPDPEPARCDCMLQHATPGREDCWGKGKDPYAARCCRGDRFPVANWH